ncbi:hypothetical protein EYR40_008499 [Pleurotus pulmonarius]|nr:hypothetical protein EYR38_008518 [Pleurotus pulmonarius]KAF4593709.1 hypothetical protein EYR40_008499 [Pleurotus pulmonarius]
MPPTFHPVASAQLRAVLEEHGITIIDLLNTFIAESPNAGSVEGSVTTCILHGLLSCPVALVDVQEWACHTASNIYASQLVELLKKAAGLHFGGSKATALTLQEFNLDDLATLFRRDAPDLWRCYDQLLCADPGINRQHERRRQQRYKARNTARDAALAQFQPVDCDLSEEMDMDSDEDKDDINVQDDRAHQGRVLITTIRKVVITCIMLLSTNQRCNSFQCMIGIFLHSCNTPEDVIKTLARLGISVTPTTINDAVTSLSKESTHDLRRLGKTLTTGFAYDNVDIELKHTVPTLEKPHETLVHLTSGTLIPLDHGVTREDLDCSKELWESEDKLLGLHPEEDHPSQLLCQFSKFFKDLGKPEVVTEIPLVKSTQVPAQMMDISPSTPQGNGKALADLFKQANIGDPTENGASEATDVKNYIVLVHRDLLTSERIQSFQASRSVEKTQGQRSQFVIFLMGMFHLKMACADAIWRICIENKDTRKDPSSLIKFVGILRKKETAKIETKLGFRRMHEVIEHTATLKDFAKKKPTWEEIQDLSIELAKNFIANPDFHEMRQQNPGKRDEVKENSLLQQEYFLLYEELTYAMNEGDIGRLESCFMPWVFIFRGCRKHKHSPAKLATAFKALGIYMDEIRANEFVKGRKASYRIPDKKSEGRHLGLIKEAKGIRGEVLVGGVGTESTEEAHGNEMEGNGGEGDSGEEDSGEGRAEFGKELEAELEVEDDGDLDV